MIDIPGYKIQRTLGKGGMASVYLAIQESFEREVALKVMNPNLSEDSKFSERFLREAKIVSRLVHPNIVTVYDVGVHNQQHYLSMEYIPGQDLKHKRKQLTIKEGLQVVRDVARALDYASKKGYVHRDVKPENIMLHEEDGRAVLMDFGIACLSDTASGMTQTGTAIGTPHYMSPEQAKGRAVDPRSDVYSLGVVLFLLVTGHVPYDADSAVAVGIKHVSEAIPLLPKALKALQPIIDKVMAKEPADRYQTGAELIAAIELIDPEELRAIELHASRSAPGQINSPTPTALSKAQLALKSANSNPDLTTVSAAALQTRNNTQVPNTQPGNPSAAVPASSSQVSGKSGINARVATGQQPQVIGKSGTGSQAAVKTEARSITARQQAVSATSSTTGTHKTGDTRPERLSALSGQAAATPDKAKAKKGSDSLYVDEEDRRDRNLEPEQKSRWPWMVAAAILLVISASVYFRSYFPEPVAGGLEQVAESGREIKNSVATSLGMKTAPAQNNLPAAVAPPSASELEPPPVQEEVALSAPGEAIDADSPLDSAQNSLSSDNVAADTLIQDQPGQDQGVLGQAGSLRDQMKTDLSVAPQLARLYRDTLRENPDMRSAEWGLRDVREFHERNIREAQEQRDTETMQRYLSSLEASFPGELAEDPKHQALRQQLESAQRARVHIDKASAFVEADALTSPNGANALESYRKALEIDPDNPLALAGLQKIVNRYVELSQASADQGKWEEALQIARRGLNIDKTNKDLLNLQEEGGRQLEQRSKISALLTGAREQLNSGNLIEPKGESAFDRYQKLLSYDSGNADARAGLREVERQLAFRIEGMINKSQFDQARQAINHGSEIFPGSERMDGLSRSLEVAEEADFIASQPKIPQMIISGQLPGSIDQPQADTLQVDRTLHIGFSYANFASETSLVLAVLWDGSRAVEIAQVPVVVSGKEGVKFFQIDRPVEGFPDGGYNVDLLLNDNKLRDTAFRVSNQ